MVNICTKRCLAILPALAAVGRDREIASMFSELGSFGSQPVQLFEGNIAYFRTNNHTRYAFKRMGQIVTIESGKVIDETTLVGTLRVPDLKLYTLWSDSTKHIFPLESGLYDVEVGFAFGLPAKITLTRIQYT
ncbi:hypothetical protein [Enterovibrio norvegicus]|uniref:hypothetical protein n=1 Tax=Enterovibrio norvegicus TaxID=188144 RepID=UPI00352EA7D7